METEKSNYMHVVEMGEEQMIELYMKQPALEIAKMLYSCNQHLNATLKRLNEQLEKSTVDNQECKPDFEAFKEQIKKLVYAFHSVGAFGWRPNSRQYWEDIWKVYLNTGVIPKENSHQSDWHEKLPLEKIYSSMVIPLREENEKLRKQIAKDVD